MKYANWAAVAAIGLCNLCIACDNDPAKGANAATVSEPEAAPQALSDEDAKSAERFVFSGKGSKVGFVGAKVTGTHRGTFNQFSGAIDVVGKDPTASQVSVEIDMGSVEADVAKLTGHLKSGDLFDVASFPKAKFSSTAISKAGADFSVTGNLELHGVTKSITFPATIHIAESEVHVIAKFVINRKDFGIVYPGMPDDLIKDEVRLDLTLTAKKAAQ